MFSQVRVGARCERKIWHHISGREHSHRYYRCSGHSNRVCDAPMTPAPGIEPLPNEGEQRSAETGKVGHYMGGRRAGWSTKDVRNHLRACMKFLAHGVEPILPFLHQTVVLRLADLAIAKAKIKVVNGLLDLLAGKRPIIRSLRRW